MDVVEFIFLFIAITIIDVVFLAMFETDRFNFVNPVANYHEWTEMNWFGVIFFTIIINVTCPVISACYWFWKLCTVGRKE